MNIGIDLDGVVFDTENELRIMTLIQDVEEGGVGEIDRENAHFYGRLSWDKEKEENYYLSHLEDLEMTSRVMFGAKYVIKKLREKGHKLFVITNRGNTDPREVEFSNKRLKNEGIEFDGYFYHAKDKDIVCKENNIDLFIDDYYDNILRVKNAGFKCLFYRDQILKFFENDPLVHEVRNWADIYFEVENFDKWK